MNRHSFRFNAFGVVIGLLAFGALAHAQATRTWVSGVGDDVNPCSRTAPCKTFAGAISKTATGGEISVLDPGGFGVVTITKAITINGEGTLASISACGTAGINVNAPSTAVVRLIDIKIIGCSQTTTPGTNGINYIAGKQLILEDVKIYDFNTSCVLVNGSGLQLHASNSTFTNCTSGVIAQAGGRAVIRTSSLVRNTNAGVVAGQTGVGAGGIVDVDSSTLSFNGTAALGGLSGFVNLSNNLIAFNTLGVNANGGGISTFADPVGTTSGLTNRFVNNTSDGIIPSGGGITVNKK